MEYQEQIQKHQKELAKLSKKYNIIGSFRLLAVVGILLFFYYFLTTYSNLFLILSGVSFIVLLGLIRIHVSLVNKRNILKALIQINQDEISFLERDSIPFENGNEFADPHHPYSHDLDIFGPNSLFNILNRTSTYSGKIQLKKYLLELNTIEEIERRQQAIQELSQKLEWRHKISALAKAKPDSEEIYVDLEKWAKTETKAPNLLLNVLAIILPVLTFTLLGLYLNDSTFIWGKLTISSFLFNVFIVFRKMKDIKNELINSSKIDTTLKNYSEIIREIENQEFQSLKLIQIQNQLKDKDIKSSLLIHQLSNLFSQLENIQNPLGAFLINGFIMYHIHSIRSMAKWKDKHAHRVIHWIDAIGELEALSSMANMAYNNPNFCFPELNEKEHLAFENLGHPLLDPNTRVDNSIEFKDFKFVILTGSNMSGKSTFLRSLGINMILGNMGAPICAKKASIHPMQVLVSMRLSDSLTDSESYFFAEVKRLKQIMELAQNTISFVLLDEILRGTNSDDKREGTIDVIKKIIQKNVYGAIATHDLKVCDISKEYPNILSNQNFEVEIINNELHFDYKLRQGVCQNKSATFLMKKMGVI